MKLLIIVILFVLVPFMSGTNCYFNHHNLCERQKIENIQELEYYPVNSLKAKYYQNGTLENIKFGLFSDKAFSLIETDYYPTQCLKNYFIKANMLCPIIDIKLKNRNSYEYQNYIKINDEEYLFYTRENKLGKLYKSFNYYDFKNNKEDIISIDKIIRSELNKLSNPLHKFKLFIFCF